MTDVLIIWLGFTSFSVLMGLFVSSYERREQVRRDRNNEALFKSHEKRGEDD